jgi:hypothetical protein
VTSRFDGAIVGVGTASGTRLVLGLWPESPFGSIQDAMVEHPDGHRVLVAPSAEVGQYIAGTYQFDEVRIEPTELHIRGNRWTFASSSLQVTLTVGRRTGVGVLLSVVPRVIARTRIWCAVTDPVARRVRPGVRTRGTAGGGRREWYCGLDERRVVDAQASWEGVGLGELRPVDPPVRFGFGSTPRVPCWVRVTTFVD